MISGGLNGGNSAMEVSLAYLASMLFFALELIEIAYLECTQLLVEYANGNMEAGEELILTAKINVVCTALFSYGGSVVKPILRNTALKHLVTTFGDDVAELMLLKVADPQDLWSCVKTLRKTDFTDDAIRTLVFQMENACFVKLSQMAMKNLPKGLLHALSQNEAAVRNITNVADLVVFKSTQKNWDIIVQLLAERGDDFIRVYKLYQDEVVEVLAVCGSDAITYVDLYQKAFLDMALAHGAVYKALYDKYGAEYGQELTAKCILYVDELLSLVTSVYFANCCSDTESIDALTSITTFFVAQSISQITCPAVSFTNIYDLIHDIKIAAVLKWYYTYEDIVQIKQKEFDPDGCYKNLHS